MTKNSLLNEIKNKVNISSERSEEMIRLILRGLGERNNLWILIYDFLKARKNSSKVRKFYRNLKKLDGWIRRTNSEMVFEDLEQALLVKELAEHCGAETSINGGVELPDETSHV